MDHASTHEVLEEGEQPCLLRELTRNRLPVLGSHNVTPIIRSVRRGFSREMQRKLLKGGESPPTDPADLFESAEDATGAFARSRILRTLREQKPRYSQEQRHAIADAAIDGDFGEVGNDKPAELMAALSLRMLIEHRRMGMGIALMRSVEQETLQDFGMSSHVRRALVGSPEGERGLLHRLRGGDFEFLRQHARGFHGRSLPAWAHDAVRERRRQYEGLRQFADTLEGGCVPEFGGQEITQKFVHVVRMIAEGYRTHDANGHVVSRQLSRKAASDAMQACEQFYGKHAHFPLLLIPPSPSCTYLEEEMGKGLDYDAGVLVAWRSPQHQAEEQRLADFRAPLSTALLTEFPQHLREEDVAALRHAPIHVAADIASFGAGKKLRAFAIDLGGGALILENIQGREEVAPARDTLRSLTPRKWHPLIMHEAFPEVMRTLTALHEFLHRIYPEKGRAAKRLGKQDAELAEAKSDIGAMVMLPRVYGKRAEELFGNDAALAMQLAALGSALSELSWSNPHDESSPYWRSAVMQWNAFEVVGMLERTGKGSITLNPHAVADHPAADVLAPVAQSILHTYHMADAGKQHEAQKSARRMVAMRPQKLVAALAKQL